MNARFAMGTEVIQGRNSIEEMGAVIKSLSSKPSVMICTDKGIVNAGIAKKITEQLDENDISYQVFDEVVPNPKIKTVEEGRDFLHKHDLNLLLAVGGGSSIDTAKAIAVIHAGGGEIERYEGRDKLDCDALPIIAVPTTYGTGSEANKATLVTNEKTKTKMVIVTPQIQPTHAFIDPEMMVKLPAAIGAATAVDALTHAIESYTSKIAQPITDGLNLHAISLITMNAPSAAMRQDDYESTTKVAIGSTMAGMAFGNTGLGLVHAISHAIGGITDVAHGVLNAILLPYVMEFNLPAVSDRYRQVGEVMGVDMNGISDVEGAKMTCEKVRELCQLLEIPTRLKDVGISSDIFEETAIIALKDGNYLRNRREATKKDIQNILLNAL